MIGLIFCVSNLLALSLSSSSVKSTTSWEPGGGGWGVIVVVFLIIDVLFVNVVVVVKQGINCCNDGPVVRIGVRKLLNGRGGTVAVGPFEFDVEYVPLTCWKLKKNDDDDIIKNFLYVHKYLVYNIVVVLLILNQFEFVNHFD